MTCSVVAHHKANITDTRERAVRVLTGGVAGAVVYSRVTALIDICATVRPFPACLAAAGTSDSVTCVAVVYDACAITGAVVAICPFTAG